MPTLRVKIDQQRWDGPTQRWQSPGEVVEISHDDPERFRQACLPYAFNSTPISGDWPEFDIRPSTWFNKVRKKTQEVTKVAGQATGKVFKSLKELTEPGVETKQDSKGWVCVECDKHFKSEKGLTRHLKRSGHGKKKPE